MKMFKLISLVIISHFVVSPVFSQSDWYKPDASDLLGVDASKYKTIGSIRDYFQNPYLELNSEPKHGFVLYKPLLNTPVAILAKNKAEAALCLSEFKKINYKSSNQFGSDFSSLLSKTVDSSDISKFIGVPSSISDEDGDVYCTYHYPGFFLTFIKGTAMSKTYLDDYTKVDATKAKILGVGLSDVGINLSDTDNDYVTGIRFSVFNFSKKKVKYIYATVSAYNAVDDLVSKKVATGVGPILPGDNGAYSFDNLFFSKIIESVKITSLKLLYFDGSAGSGC